MRRLSYLTLALVLAFLAGVGGLLVLRGRTVRPEPSEPVFSRADYRIKAVHIQEETDGEVRWKLEADHAEVFHQLGKTAMEKVTVTILEPERTWTVTADEGELLDATKNIHLRRNVVLVSTEGLRLEAETLHWDAKGRRVWTDQPVTLIRGAAVLKGRGIEALMADERTKVMGRLRVTIRKEKSAPVSLFGVTHGAS